MCAVLEISKRTYYKYRNTDDQVKDLKVRKWTCNNCKMEHDRDINASINIMIEGIKKYMKEIEQI